MHIYDVHTAEKTWDTSGIRPLFFGIQQSKHDSHHSVSLSANGKNV